MLAGLIRDFCDIRKSTLKKEIDALEQLLAEGKAPAGVSEETIQAMHDLRAVGNIGAHMEKDVDLIVDVEPGEAQLLIELIEMLFKDWYVAREERRARLQALRELADSKEAERTAERAAESVGESMAAVEIEDTSSERTQ